MRLLPAVILALLMILPVLGQPRIVFLGEQHTSEADHQAQLAALRDLHAAGPVTIVAEMFTERAEGELQAWNGGADFSDFGPELWMREWGHPQELYRPIFAYAREKSLPVVWLRPDPDYTKQIREKGPAAAVPRLGEVLIGPSSYRDFMARIARDHGHGEPDQAMIDRLFTVQCFWDEFMAWRLADLAQQHPGQTLVVLIGDGHLRDNEGIPWRLHRRAPDLQLEVRRANAGLDSK